jgi:pimeloyl-ACP methyl ester carboxylesterase
VFDFTEENKHSKGQPKITRQMARAAKHNVGSVPAGGQGVGSAGVGAGGGLGASAELLPLVAGKKMTRVDLEDFLLRHPMHRLRGTTWNYMHITRTTVLAREKMVVLSCGGVRCEVFFELLEALAEQFDVVALMLPRELSTMEDYLAGLELVRAGLQIAAPFHLYGVAMGGAVALQYAHDHPSRLRSLVLSHTAPPDPEFGRLCERFAAKVQRADEKDTHMPSALSRALLGHRVRCKNLARDVPQMMGIEGMLVFWKKVLKRFALDSVSVQAKLTALAKYHLETVYGEKDFAELRCPVLLLDTERNDAFGRRSLEQLRRLMPHATVEVVEGFGSLAVLVKGHELAHVVLRWMTKSYFAASKQQDL